MVTTNSGNVGIGTQSPAAKLHVAGDIQTDSSLRSRGDIRVLDSTGAAKIILNSTQATVPILQVTGGADLAEPFALAPSGAANIVPGMVVVIDPVHAGRLTLSTQPYDRRVAGIVSGANGVSPGMIMKGNTGGAEGSRLSTQHSELSTSDVGTQHSELGTQHSSLPPEQPVALSGRVWCWCDAAFGSITPGDLLTTSATAGHAMRASDDHAIPRGCIIGKAMSPLPIGRGLVLVLVQPQ